MFYKQDINNIKLVIISLDGGLLDLNHLRYNYFRKICKIHGLSIGKEEFEKSLGNMNTMYENFPITSIITPEKLNTVIERDLFEYAKLKPDMLIKEGSEELLQFFKQKNIKVAVLSTHKIKRAMQYLQLTRLYDKVDFIIGGDSNNPPLPDTFVLTTILEQMQIDIQSTLVIANFPTLLYSANHNLMNTIYLKDLCTPGKSINSRVFKVAKNNLEIINIFLFARYDTLEMYSPILGMSKNMDLATLEKTYHRLLKEYSDDSQLTTLVQETYQYYLTEIINHNHIQTPLEDTFEYESNEILLEPSNIDDEQEIEESSTNDGNQFFNSENIQQMDEDLTQANSLINLINGDTDENIEQIKENIPENKDKETPNNKNHFLGFTYTLLTDVIISLCGLLAFVGFEDFIMGPGIFAGVLKTIIDAYINIVMSAFAVIFNLLHSLINTIPSYYQFIADNTLLSSLAIKLCLCIIFNLIIIYIIKLVYYLLTVEVEDSDAFTTEN